MNEAHSQTSLVVPNMHEYAQKGMDADYPALLMAKWRNISSGFAEVALFWEGDEKLIVAPQPIDGDFVDYVVHLLQYHSIKVVTPQHSTTELSLDTLNDESVLTAIKAFAGAGDDITLRPWGATRQVYALLEQLDHLGLRVSREELPVRESYWSCSYIDSKIGFREMCVALQRTPSRLQIPRGFTCDSLESAVEVLRWFHTRRVSCVLKASSGVGGYGNVFIREELCDQPFWQVEKYVRESIRALPYFKHGAAIVEEIICSETEMQGSSHACSRSVFMSGLIQADGTTRLIGGGTDFRDDECHYVGAELGKLEVFDVVGDATREVMLRIGEAIASYGYRGHWGVNFIVSNACPVAIELNARRCGESHAYALAERLYGPSWMSECYVITRLPVHVQVRPGVGVKSVLRAFEKTNRKLARSGLLAVPTEVSWLHQPTRGLGYVVLGTEQSAVRAAERELDEALASEGIICEC